MVMTQFIYLHGFNSGYDPEADKIKILEKIGKVSGITYDTYASYEEIKEYLLRNIDYSDDLVMVGTSLGGYWASEIAKVLKVPSVIINPCHEPSVMLKKYEDCNNENHQTGKINCLTRFVTETYKDKDLVGNTEEFFYTPLVLLDSGDEVISSTRTSNVLSEFPMKIFGGGNHRFAHMNEALEYIQNYIRTCEIAEHTN
jgi:predicted esterase YcpF (UPF0227 family)